MEANSPTLSGKGSGSRFTNTMMKFNENLNAT